ncbi:MAG: histidyl-tRNA synthetase [Thermotogaceae bacterium]|nr:histidyl-tRNA synthetase [Thermotogaceae bacterium]MDN5336988.1 histidyl-tRNA synthetase [Thermotogaceae bacterium]
MISKPKGTVDIFGDELKYWYFVEDTFRRITQLYNYYEIRTPVFEATELFLRGVGEETDIVQKQMYTFEDKGGRSLTLRPEGTAPVMRAYIENSLVKNGLPQKFSYLGPVFRYEKPQAGRMRQFHQFGVELIGSPHAVADFEVIKLAIDILDALNLHDYKLYIGNIGCKNCRPKFRKALKDYYQPKLDLLCSDCQKRFDTNILRLLDCKDEKCKPFQKDAPKTFDYLCEDCKEHFDELLSYLEGLNVSYELDGHLVRGLDYYTKTVFEIKHSSLGAQDTIIGGGRYDGLIEELGGKVTPSIGFAGGIERIILALKNENVTVPELKKCQVYIAVLSESARIFSLKLSQNLRDRGIVVEMDLMKRNIRNQMKYADRLGAKYVLIIGDDELEKGVLTIRDMETGQQVEVDEKWIENYIVEKFEE